MEHNSYYKKGGNTQPKPKPTMGKKVKPKEPQIVRYYFEDEPFEYGKGGNTTSILEAFKKKFEENEDDNYHSENVVLLAKHFGDADDLKKAKQIMALHNKEGHLSSENGRERYRLYEKLLAVARKQMSEKGLSFAKGGAIYKGNRVKIKETGKTMKVTDISKGKKGYVEFTGSEGTFLKGDIDKMAKGGEIDKTGSSKIFDLEYGDVFLVTRKEHTASGYYVYLDLYEEYNKVYLECLPFPSLRPEFGGKHVLIDGVQDGDIKIISKEKAGKMLLDYMIDREKIKPLKKRQGKKAYSKMAKGGSTEGCWCYEIGGF
jgi:TPR repeat protein